MKGRSFKIGAVAVAIVAALVVYVAYVSAQDMIGSNPLRIRGHRHFELLKLQQELEDGSSYDWSFAIPDRYISGPSLPTGSLSIGEYTQSGGVGGGPHKSVFVISNGGLYFRGSKIHGDYVFDDDYKLESIEEHARKMWEEKHLPSVPKRQIDENDEELEVINLTTHNRGITEELEIAHIYIERLNKEIKELRAEIEALKGEKDSQ